MKGIRTIIKLFIIALGSFVGNSFENQRQNALLAELDSFDANLKKQLKGYVRLVEPELKVAKDKLELLQLELQKKENLLQEKELKQLAGELFRPCFVIV